MATRARVFFDELTAPGNAAERWARIEKLKADAEEESLWLDFKEVAPGAVPANEAFIREKLARALSGFANTEGGVLLYGVRTKGAAKGSPDRAQEIVEIDNVGAFRAGLEKLASVLVDPVVGNVVVEEIVNAMTPSCGVVAVFVPASNGGPHRVVRAGTDANDRYYMRTTTEFVVLPHTLLADRFGRTASPRLELRIQFTDAQTLELRLRNEAWEHDRRRNRPLPEPAGTLSFTRLTLRLQHADLA